VLLDITAEVRLYHPFRARRSWRHYCLSVLERLVL